MVCNKDPGLDEGLQYFSMEKKMRYMPFCADFGPFNLGMTHHFLLVLDELFKTTCMCEDKLVYYTSPNASDVTNAIFLLGSFLVCHLGASADEAWTPFCNLNYIVRPYRDATWAPSPYDLHVKECWGGLAKAISTGLYNPSTFDKEEYFYCATPSCPHSFVLLRN